jgi:flagellar biosynthetic protein FliO
MNRIVLIVLLALGSAGLTLAQNAPAGKTAAKPPATVSATAASAPVAPLPDEKTLTIADSPGSSPTSASGPSTDIGPWEFVKMFVILALVIGMILAFVWFMRRLSGRAPGNDAPIKVLHTHSLGGNRTLQVVEVGTDVLLIGTGDGGVHLVKDLTGTEAADSFRLAASQRKTSGAQGFSDLLGGLLGVKPKIRPDVGQPVENSSDFLKKQRERLKKL